MWKYMRLPSGSARLSVGYITTGVLIVIWTVVWLVWMQQNDGGHHGEYYICGGLLFSGLALVVIGALVGHIGHAAKHADAAAPMTEAAVSNAPSPAQNVMTPMNAVAPGAAPMMMTPAAPASQATTATPAPGQVPQNVAR